MQTANSGNQPRERLAFLDVLKGIAVIAVVCDHCKCWSLHCSLPFLHHAVFFYSVSLFVLCAGYTSALSLEYAGKKQILPLLWITKKIVRILEYYLIATAFCLLIMTPTHVIDFAAFVNACINFNAAKPFYFIAFFLQLLCFAPFSYQLFSVHGGKWHEALKFLFYLLTILLACCCWEYTSIGAIYGGGHHLLGASYLAVYVTGQLLYIYRNFIFRKINNFILLVLSLLFFIFFHAKCFDSFKYVCCTNPPGCRLIFYAATIFFAVSFLFLLIPRILPQILSPISFLGKYSLEIFLYHFLVMNLCNRYIQCTSKGIYAGFSAAVIFGAYLFLPALGAILFRYIKIGLNIYKNGEK